MQLNYQIFSALICVTSIVTAQDYYDYDNYNERQTNSNFICTKEGYHEDRSNCRTFYRCVDWGDGRPMTPFKQECGEGTVFSKIKGNICTFPWDSGRAECDGSDNDVDSNLDQNQNANVSPQMPECNAEGWIPDPDDCMRFYRCVNEGYGNFRRHPFTCAAGTIWDPEEEICNHPSVVNRPECNTSGSSGQSPDHSIMPPQYPGHPSAPGQNDYPNYPNAGAARPPTGPEQIPMKNDNEDKSPTIPSSSNGSGPMNPAGTSNLDGSPGSSNTPTHDVSGSPGIDQSPISSQLPASSNDSNESSSKQPTSSNTPTRPSIAPEQSNNPNKVDSSGSNESTSPSSIGTPGPTYIPVPTKRPSQSESPGIDTQGMSNDIPENERPGDSPVTGSAPTELFTGSCTAEGFFPNPKNCRKFIRCVGNSSVGYRRFDFDCGPGTAWDHPLQTCNYAHLVDACKSQDMQTTSQPSPPSTQSPTTASSSKSPDSITPSQTPDENTKQPQTTSTEKLAGPDNDKDCDKPHESSNKPNYPVKCDEEGFKPVPEDCQKFYRCVNNGNGFNVYHFECSKGTIFDPSINVCNYPESVYPPRKCEKIAQTTPMSSATTASPSEATSPDNTDLTTKSDEMITTTETDKTSTAESSTLETMSITDIMSTTEEQTTTGTEGNTNETENTTEKQSTTESMSTTDDSSTTQSSTDKGTTIAEDSSTMPETTTVEGETTTESSKATEEMTTVDTDTTPEITTMQMETTSAMMETTSAVMETSSAIMETTEGTTSSDVDMTTSALDTTSPIIPPGAFPCPVPNLTGDQFVLACPSGFRRYPKYCNLFYQCTTSDAMEVKILVFSCPKDTIFDEKKIQCIPEEESEQPCEGYQNKPTRVYRAAPNLPTTSIEVSTHPLCPSEGHFPYKIGCSNTFYKCTKGTNELLQGYLYKCPEDFVYWSVSRRCERVNRLPMCTYVGTKNMTEAYKNKVLGNLPTEYMNISARKNRII